MKVRRYFKTACWVFLPLAVFWIWYMIAADYSYRALAGTYIFQQDGERAVLTLKKDRTFSQELTCRGKLEHVQGTWRRVGEGGVVFSKEFLPVSDVHGEPDGSTYGEFQKSFFELVPSIVLGPDRNSGPRFRFHLFR